MKVLHKIKAVFKYLGCLIIMVAIMACAIVCSAGDMEAIKLGLIYSGILAGCSLPCWAVVVTVDIIFDRWGVGE